MRHAPPRARHARRRPALGTALAAAASLAIGTTVVAGPSGGALPPVLIQVLDVHGSSVVADDAAMVAVNVTATRAAGGGYFAAFPCDGPEPATSNVNYLADQNVPNFALVRIADDGTICIATSEVADLIVDIVGYVPTGSTITPLDQPVRVADTRSTTTLTAGATLRVPAAVVDGVGADATSVMANITAINRSEETGFLTTHPCRPTPPGTSSLNFGPRATRANFVTTRLDADGTFCITTSQRADVIVDIAAWDTTGFRTLPEPVRLVDTRDARPVQPGRALQLDIAGRSDVPDDATAAVYNLTAANANGVGYATSHPCLGTPPTASNLNFVAGPPVANGTITKLSGSGRLCVDVSVATNLIVDLIGYTVGTGDYVPTTPTRLHDSRAGWRTTCPWLIETGVNSSPAYLLDVSTGAERVAQIPLGHLRSDLTIDRDCTTLLWFDHVLGVLRGYSFATGQISTVLAPSGPTPVGGPTRSAVGELWDGTYVFSDGYQVVDLATGDPIFTPPSPAMVTTHAISSNGVWARAYSTDGEPGPRRVEFWDIASGTELGELPLEDAERVIDLSFGPSPIYLAVGLSDEAPDAESRNWILISTVFGDVVDAVRGDIPLRPRFTGTGQLHFCAANVGLYRWDLFGPIAPVGIDGWGGRQRCNRA